MSTSTENSGKEQTRPGGRATRDDVARPLRCASCGYEIIRYHIVPDCPMCGDFAWEPVPWRPFSR